MSAATHTLFRLSNGAFSMFPLSERVSSLISGMLRSRCDSAQFGGPGSIMASLASLRRHQKLCPTVFPAIDALIGVFSTSSFKRVPSLHPRPAACRRCYPSINNPQTRCFALARMHSGFPKTAHILCIPSTLDTVGLPFTLSNSNLFYFSHAYIATVNFAFYMNS